MIFFDDTLLERPRIEKAIKKYGYAPEHNFEWYQCQPEERDKNVFVEFKDGSGLLTIETVGKKECTVFSSPVAPAQKRTQILIEYLNEIFKSGKILKAELELEDELYKKFIEELPKNMNVRKIRYTLVWPVYELAEFDPSLSGNSWKSLRKTKNKFYQQHSVKIVDAKKYQNNQELHNIINDWRKNRGGKDRAYFHEYHKLIDKNFSAATKARVLAVDGKACGINAGWMIPDSNKFYGALGIHNYSVPGLGDVLYLEDLSWLKAKGYKEADMGGGEKALTDFKTKFHPKSFYKTHIFNVVKA